MSNEGVNGRVGRLEARVSEFEDSVEDLQRDSWVFLLAVVVLSGAVSLLLLRQCQSSAALASPSKPVPSISFTFDDGPSRATPRILDELKISRVRATFFVLGARLQSKAYCAYLRRAARDGHRIANHLWSHHSPCKLGRDGTMRQLRRTDRDIRRCLGEKLYQRAMVHVYRPPFGHRCYSQAVVATGYRVRMWDVADLGRTPATMWRKAQFWARWKARRGKEPHVTILIHHRADKLKFLLRVARKAGWRIF